jgi:hypothetical protein
MKPLAILIAVSVMATSAMAAEPDTGYRVMAYNAKTHQYTIYVDNFNCTRLA